MLPIIAVTTEYFHEIHNNGNSEKRQHFDDSTFRLYLVLIRNPGIIRNPDGGQIKSKR